MTIFDAEWAYRIFQSAARRHKVVTPSLEAGALSDEAREFWEDVAQRISNVVRDRIAGIVAEALRDWPSPEDIRKAMDSWTSDSPDVRSKVEQEA